jgi:hypothetical protein
MRLVDTVLTIATYRSRGAVIDQQIREEEDAELRAKGKK